MSMMSWFSGLFKREPMNHYTVDGGLLAPHPGMTDEDLYDFECHELTGSKPELRTWPTLEAYHDYCSEKEEDEPETFVEGLDRYVEDQEAQDWVAITEIVVPTARDKVQLLLALKYIHDLRCIDTNYIAVNTLVHQYQQPDFIRVQASVCDVAPTGWLCTREPGHEGPCAAWPL